MPKTALRLALLFLTLLLVGCDHATKTAAKAAFAHGPPVSVVDLTYAENRDSAFSLFHAFNVPWKNGVIAAFALMAIVFICVLWWQNRHEDLSLHVGAAFVLAGAIGNVSDRLMQGYVVDFIHVHHWPVFNVADIAVGIGGAIFALRHVLLRIKDRRVTT